MPKETWIRPQSSTLLANSLRRNHGRCQFNARITQKWSASRLTWWFDQVSNSNSLSTTASITWCPTAIPSWRTAWVICAISIFRSKFIDEPAKKTSNPAKAKWNQNAGTWHSVEPRNWKSVRSTTVVKRSSYLIARMGKKSCQNRILQITHSWTIMRCHRGVWKTNHRTKWNEMKTLIKHCSNSWMTTNSKVAMMKVIKTTTVTSYCASNSETSARCTSIIWISKQIMWTSTRDLTRKAQ